jgi:3D (Asp-Asp-Asp) domain-containing protein
MTNILTAYCACAVCCGPTAPRLTAAGTVPVEGRTIAAPAWVPFGTRVEVTVPGRWTNRVFIVEDRTKSQRGWDVYLRTHAKAKQFGRKVMIWKTTKTK